MGSKIRPGSYDCYANALPDEPIFTLLGRDRHAPKLIEQWADARAREGEDPSKVEEARAVAKAMIDYQAQPRKPRVWPMVNLGELILGLQQADSRAHVVFDFMGYSPAGLNSYRGYYDHLAIDFSLHPITVGIFLPTCKRAVNGWYTGYKGGKYQMSLETPIWVAPYEQVSDTVITGFEHDRDEFVIQTGRYKT